VLVLKVRNVLRVRVLKVRSVLRVRVLFVPAMLLHARAPTAPAP
jgi:hypothetical protein